MSADDANSFNSDHVKDHVNGYARQYSEFVINHLPEEQKQFIIIKVEQFNEIHVICGGWFCSIRSLTQHSIGSGA
ncbi:MAG: hypothetical protein WCF03_05015 [Nitrososphaeraceae archaeon]